ncbi:unnamed protein product [Thlaspi arvense]|uniref:Uncharacterized protein n=1 Tax=Thlaspi arvense TaxID=13288 RepID=A0AAU9RZG6_THLAR|nr:unnamed protein product [Thlaspi arvense]
MREEAVKNWEKKKKKKCSSPKGVGEFLKKKKGKWWVQMVLKVPWSCGGIGDLCLSACSSSHRKPYS